MCIFNAVTALKESDEIVFRELFYEYYEKVYFYILSQTHSSYLAEETAQLTFIKLWNFRNSLDESLDISKQIFRIAKTTCIDLLRKETNKSKLLTVRRNSETFIKNVSETLEVKELQAKLAGIVQNMPPVRKKVFELSRYEARSHKEISEMLNLSVKTVKNHIALALREIRHIITLLLLGVFLLLF